MNFRKNKLVLESPKMCVCDVAMFFFAQICDVAQVAIIHKNI